MLYPVICKLAVSSSRIRRVPDYNLYTNVVITIAVYLRYEYCTDYTSHYGLYGIIDLYRTDYSTRSYAVTLMILCIADHLL